MNTEPELHDDDADYDEPAHREDNVEFMTRMLTFARSGPLMHAFILGTLGKQAERIAAMPLEEFKVKFGEAANMIHPESWYACAVELDQEFKKRLG